MLDYAENMRACVLSHFSLVQLFETFWTVTHQAPLSMGFSRQEHWSELPCPPAGDLPDPGIEPVSLTSPSLAGGLLTRSTTCAGRQGFYQLYLHGASQSHTEKGIFFFSRTLQLLK